MSDPKTTTAAYLSSGTAIVFGLSASEIAALVGAMCALLTFAVNWYYKHQSLKLMMSQIEQKERKHESF